ncbi:MAG: ketopantoate reductase family protein [Bacteroidales bacterium]|jgi:2-dehydropantoate 2-reductase
MNQKDLSILVVGAGAIGGITAAILKRSGYDVEIIAKYDDYAGLISSSGFHISGARGNFIQKMKAWSAPTAETGRKDIILLATKATDMMEAAREVVHLLKDDGLMVSLQNGICEDDLAKIAGRNRIVGCVVAWGATMISRGDLFMSSTGEFVIGYLDGNRDERLENISEILSSIVPVRITDNIMGHLYSKLIINSCITLPGAISGLHVGKMLSERKIRKIFIEIMREALAVSVKMGIKVEKFGKRLDFYRVVEKEGLIADLKRHLLMRIIGFRYRKLRSSSLQSLERGKPTEVDYFNGYIARNGSLHGVDTPVNTAIVKIIHEIEAGKRKISLTNFNDPVFDRFN